MKKLTDHKINSLFRKILPNTADYFNYFGEINQLKLDGIFSSKQLAQLALLMDDLLKGTDQDPVIKKIQNLNIKGFKAKDIKVIYYKMYDEEGYNFSFYIMKDGKDWDFYYGQSDQGAGSWWPNSKDSMYLSPIHQFIPPGFCEACENAYEYHGKNEDAIELLKTCGFTVERGEDQCD